MTMQWAMGGFGAFLPDADRSLTKKRGRPRDSMESSSSPQLVSGRKTASGADIKPQTAGGPLSIVVTLGMICILMLLWFVLIHVHVTPLSSFVAALLS